MPKDMFSYITFHISYMISYFKTTVAIYNVKYLQKHCFKSQMEDELLQTEKLLY